MPGPEGMDLDLGMFVNKPGAKGSPGMALPQGGGTPINYAGGAGTPDISQGSAPQGAATGYDMGSNKKLGGSFMDLAHQLNAAGAMTGLGQGLATLSPTVSKAYSGAQAGYADPYRLKQMGDWARQRGGAGAINSLNKQTSQILANPELTSLEK